jgi:hypothetical protein
MSIDNFIWVPAGIRNDDNIGFRKYKSWAEMYTAEAHEGHSAPGVPRSRRYRRAVLL